MPFRQPEKHRPLTKRQLEVVRLIGEGNTYTQVSEQVGLSRPAIVQIMKRDDVKLMQKEALNEALRNSSLKAARVLIKQLDDPNPWVAQQSARTIIQHCTELDKLQESTLVVNFNSMPTPAMPAPEPVEAEGSVT